MIDLEDLYKNLQKEMIGRLSLCSTAIEHPGTKGAATEINWISWLRCYLPNRYAVDKGIVIDSNGQQSDQIDVIIYDNQYSYFVFNQGDTKYVPAESIYAVFEVKQNLNKAHMDYAGKKAKSVRILHRTSAEIKHAGGKYPPKELHEIVSGILTLECDWKLPATSNVAKYINGADYAKRLDIVCSINAGTYIVHNKTFVNDDNDGDLSPNFCGNEYSLIFFFLQLLKKLQDIGTVPAIDILKYANTIPSKHYKKT